jgi:molecular chaperone HtpG
MTKNEMEFDFDGLIQLLANNLYSQKSVFLRELIQNAHDSIIRRRAREPGFGGRIDIETRPDDLRIEFRDNGIGMNDADIRGFLSRIGASGTRGEKAAVEGLVGQFGIGFLSAFVVAQRVEVLTRKVGENTGWRWVNEGRADYELTEAEVAAPGTTVVIHLTGPEHRDHIQTDRVTEAVRRYADMLSVPIHLNGGGAPVNSMRMPWEHDGRSAEERRVDSFVYLSKTMNDSVLEVIPFDLKTPVRAVGLLYLTRTRTVQVEAPRNVRLYQNRMFISDNIKEVLPKWAAFVNGVIESPDLTPTAARDNLIRNDAFDALRDELGKVILNFLSELSEKDPIRFTSILDYHELGIKAACHYHQDFFAKFWRLLRWRVNGGRDTMGRDRAEEELTLPQILDRLPAERDGGKTLCCFTDRVSANQYFEMANAAGGLTVNASRLFEGDLIESFAKLDATIIGAKLRLVRVDREDDPATFRDLGDGAEDAAVRRLAELMSRSIVTLHGGGVRVEARRFAPADLAAVVRAGEGARAQEKARSILHDPNSTPDMREMAEEMLRMSRGAGRKLFINADNPLIRRLAAMHPAQPDLQHLLINVYNNAILFNQELLTPENARVFHHNFHELLERSVELIALRSKLEERQAEVEREERRRREQAGPPPRHAVFFLMTPFADEYNGLRDALRDVLQDDWGCELAVASDRTYESRIFTNLRVHMDRACAFLAEVSDGNPNVMYELGAVHLLHPDRPVVLLHRGGADGEKPKLPADLEGAIYVDYGKLNGKGLPELLAEALRKHEKIRCILDDPQREPLVSVARLKAACARLNFPGATFDKLHHAFPTAADWRNATTGRIEEHLDAADKRLAGFVLDCVLKELGAAP